MQTKPSVYFLNPLSLNQHSIYWELGNLKEPFRVLQSRNYLLFLTVTIIFVNIMSSQV